MAWIVSETVDFVRNKEGEAASKFVNAILRRIADHSAGWRSLEWPDPADEAGQARHASLPEWIWRRIVRDHGREWAREFARASLERPVFWLRSRAPVAGASPGPLADSWRLESWRPIQDSAEYAAGEVFAQDISSQVLVRDFSDEAARIFGGLEGRTILDLCAAPGGKSSGLAWNGWRVLATDRQAETRNSKERFNLLLQTAGRIGKSLQHGGAFEVLARKEVDLLAPVDAAWVDAPCTGSGLLRRHPEIRWIKDETTLASLQREQALLLREASLKVRPGGLLMFTVCSVLRSDELGAAIRGAGVENFRVIREWLLSPHVAPFGDGFAGILLQKNS